MYVILCMYVTTYNNSYSIVSYMYIHYCINRNALTISLVICSSRMVFYCLLFIIFIIYKKKIIIILLLDKQQIIRTTETGVVGFVTCFKHIYVLLLIYLTLLFT